MAAEGTSTIGGKQYRWTSPTINDIMEFEQTTGLLLVDQRSFNSARGRAYLGELCLRKHHPEITAGIILGWPAADLVEIWEMISEAIPIFTVSPVAEPRSGTKRPPAPLPADTAGRQHESPEGTGASSTSSPSSISPDGSRAAPDRNA